jgi:hypothetical protein
VERGKKVEAVEGVEKGFLLTHIYFSRQADPPPERPPHP